MGSRQQCWQTSAINNACVVTELSSLAATWPKHQALSKKTMRFDQSKPTMMCSQTSPSRRIVHKRCAHHYARLTVRVSIPALWCGGVDCRARSARCVKPAHLETAALHVNRAKNT
eukprot:365542-Chlamydomonas_euryale.AAC.29